MRLIRLDLIRCSAIILLVTAHIGQSIQSPIGRFFGLPNFYYVSLGGVAVTIFLILSGFVLELKYGQSNIGYAQFVLKRILRIYPVYYLSLLLGVAVYCYRSFDETGHAFAHLFTLGIGDIVLSLTAGHAFVGGWGGPFVATSWFIALIITMYFCFPFLSRELKKHPETFILTLMLMSLVSRLIVGKYEFLPNRPLDWFPLCRIFEFALGIYLATLSSQYFSKRLKLPGYIVTAVSFLSFISFPLFLVHYPLLFIIKYLTLRNVHQVLAIACYVTLSLVISWIIFEIDRRIPKDLILAKMGRAYNNILVNKTRT